MLREEFAHVWATRFPEPLEIIPGPPTGTPPSAQGCSYLRRLRCEQLERRDMLALADLDTTWGGTGSVLTSVGSGTDNAVAARCAVAA